MATAELTLAGARVVVTGKIGGHSRATAETFLREQGAQVQAAVVGTTDLLVVGADVGQRKIEAAEKHGVRVISWSDAVALAAGGNPSTSPPAIRGASGATREIPDGYRPIGPMLAKQSDELPSGPSWQHEIKWDGHRGVATVGENAVRIDSRTGNDNTERFASVASDLAAFPPCILDGELVALDDQGRSCLQALGDETASFMVFDLLQLGEHDLRSLPLSERRALLESMFDQLDPKPLRVAVPPVFTDGEHLLSYVTENALEGIVSKRLDSRYQEGARPSTWLKTKIRLNQEFIVVGHTPGRGALSGHVGAWLLAVNDPTTGGLAFCGKVGTGGDGAQWDAIENSLTTVDVPPVEIPKGVMSGPELATVTWVAPERVVQCAFQRWTEDGRLWHPSFLGVRDDKLAADVVREG